MKINVLLALIIILSFLVAIVLHEWAHAAVANWLGDSTPRREGRQSLRLRAHIEPLGLIMCLFLAFQPIVALPMGLGWGAAVKPDPWKLRNGPNRGVLMVAVAGPLMNLALGILSALIVRVLTSSPVSLYMYNPVTIRVLQLFVVFAIVNFSLVLLNILPLYPLDGYQVLYTLLPSKQAVKFARWAAPYGPVIILVIFLVLPFIGRLLGIGDFFLFNLAFYVWWGAAAVIAMLTGIPVQILLGMYTF
ncbi:peptidase M50 [Ktedonobacter sp. SOSP1-52]|uniref:site-2 protease family protein n=1 Tax=Ktedonobacter sp. SOSP1-52 TaxID=2778366 RepID=UPI0019154FBA|nr:site-2 protease family protein [Ktedonobacter sp. SOSP1-52]GHO68910.1 peptidase M50 [Ktedonobacter sp. SOSP1-52]